MAAGISLGPSMDSCWLDWLHGRLADADVLLPLWSVCLPCTQTSVRVGVSKGESSPPPCAIPCPCAYQWRLQHNISCSSLLLSQPVPVDNLFRVANVTLCHIQCWSRMVLPHPFHLFAGQQNKQKLHICILLSELFTTILNICIKTLL